MEKGVDEENSPLVLPNFVGIHPESDEWKQLLEKTQPDHPGGFYFPRRYGLLFFCFMCVVISYLDRTNISVAILDISKEQGWSKVFQGVVLSAFFYGYAITQVPAGFLADRYTTYIYFGQRT